MLRATQGSVENIAAHASSARVNPLAVNHDSAKKSSGDRPTWRGDNHLKTSTLVETRGTRRRGKSRGMRVVAHAVTRNHAATVWRRSEATASKAAGSSSPIKNIGKN